MFAVIDFESSGLDAKARATEIGIVLLDKTFEIEGTFDSVLKPPVSVSQRAIGYSRLQRKEIETAPTFSQLWPQISAHLSGRILVAHGAEFDLGILERELADIGQSHSFPSLCTLRLSRKAERGGALTHDLGAVCQRMGIQLLNPHEALQDALATAEVLRELALASEEKASQTGKNDVIASAIRDLAGAVIEFAPIPTQLEPQPRLPAASADSNKPMLEAIASEILANNKVRAQRIVVKTGVLEQGESQLELELERVGLRLKETPPTAGTAFLIVGSRPGKSKAEKARSYGRPVLAEEDAYALIELIAKRGGF